jgi:hypothetical protein
MKKRELATFVMMTAATALLVVGCQNQAPKKNPNGTTATADTMDPQAQSFYNSLSSDAQIKFNQLDAMHKNKAMKNSQNNGVEANKSVEEQYNDQMKGAGATRS